MLRVVQSPLLAVFILCCGMVAALEQAVTDEEPIRAKPDGPLQLQDTMTPERLFEVIQRVDEQAEREANNIAFTIEDVSLLIVFDPSADRMRIITPVAKVEDLEEGQLLRMLQANFDSALDARYAVARDLVWSVFIHPLSSLSEEELLVGIGETVNVALTFGSNYSSGMFIFGGGDSEALERRKLIDKLKELIRT